VSEVDQRNANLKKIGVFKGQILKSVADDVIVLYSDKLEKLRVSVRDAVNRLYKQFPLDLAAAMGGEALPNKVMPGSGSKSGAPPVPWIQLSEDYRIRKIKRGMTGQNEFFLYKGVLKNYFSSIDNAELKAILGAGQVTKVEKSRTKKGADGLETLIDPKGYLRFAKDQSIGGVKVGGRFVSKTYGRKSAIKVLMFPKAVGKTQANVNTLFPEKISNRLWQKKAPYRPLIGPYIDWYRRVKLAAVMKRAGKRALE
jgi:hypothetical protein